MRIGDAELAILGLGGRGGNRLGGTVARRLADRRSGDVLRSGDLLQACAEFLKPRQVGDVRSSPWLKTVPFLHSIASASERLRAWAERDWAAQEAERLKGGRLIDGVVVPDAPWRNPFALEEAEQR